MPEAVIVSTARSPIGRAFKGSLTEVRPDDLAATIVDAANRKLVMDKAPGKFAVLPMEGVDASVATSSHPSAVGERRQRTGIDPGTSIAKTPRIPP